MLIENVGQLEQAVYDLNSTEATEFETMKRPCQATGGDLTKGLYCAKMVVVAGAIEACLDP